MKSESLTLIQPKPSIFGLEDIKEIWDYRELLFFFAWRDFKVRYKQTLIGVIWAFLQPFLTMVIFSVFFGNFAKIPSDGVPYPIFVYVGLLLWQLFSSCLSDVSNSLIANQSVVTKVYFPRLVLPLSFVVIHLADFLISSVILIGLMLYFHFAPHLESLAVLPLLLLITIFASVGLGLCLASINVKYRDVRYVLPFFIQLLLFVTPVIYPASILGKYMTILALNPMSGVISTARAILLTNIPISWESLSLSALSATILMILGLIFFKRMERYFADLV